MKRYYYNNRLAQVLLMFSTCHTIAIAWFVLSKRDESRTNQTDRNHETIHAMQWTEVTMAVGAFTLALIAIFDLSLWWIFIAPLAYYILYLLEWLCKLPSGHAYKSISFEQEAYAHDEDMNYCENRHLFCGWAKKIFKVI